VATQELRGALDAERTREGRGALLEAVAGAGAAAASDMAGLVARVLLLQHLTDPYACQRAAAAQLLAGAPRPSSSHPADCMPLSVVPHRSVADLAGLQCATRLPACPGCPSSDAVVF